MDPTDLPMQARLQQGAARPVDGAELEQFGKTAARLYTCGSASTLNDAVVQTIKSACLAPEQVRRVVEFANTDAFLHEFKKEGLDNKYVVFDGGPAAFNTVMQDLNDGGNRTVLDLGTSDYFSPPPAKIAHRNQTSPILTKTAGEDTSDEEFAALFTVDKKASPLRHDNPLQEVQELRTKFAAAVNNLSATLHSTRANIEFIEEELYQTVKQACLHAVPLGNILSAWHQAGNADLIKTASERVIDRLFDDGVFKTAQSAQQSIMKTAQSGVLNVDHPLVRLFVEYGEQVKKAADVHAAVQDCEEQRQQLLDFELMVNKHYQEVL